MELTKSPTALVSDGEKQTAASVSEPLVGSLFVVDLTRFSVSPVTARHLHSERPYATDIGVLPLLCAPFGVQLADDAIIELRHWNQPILLAADSSVAAEAAARFREMGVRCVTNLDISLALRARNGDTVLMVQSPAERTSSDHWRVFHIRGESARWFEVESIENGVYSLAEPGHREYVRSYLVVGDEEAALIDTGEGIGNIRHEVERLTRLPVRVLLTHTHWDHIGDAHRFDRVAVFDHTVERARLEAGYPRGSTQLDRLKDVQLRPKRFGRAYPPHFGTDRYEIPGISGYEVLHDGDTIELGNRTLQVIHTPGHSPGSISLLDRAGRLLFVGDFFYWGPLFGLPGEFDLDAYVRSAARLLRLRDTFDRVLPGHNELEVDEHPMGPQDLDHLLTGLQEILRGGISGQVQRVFEYPPGRFSVEVIPPGGN